MHNAKNTILSLFVVLVVLYVWVPSAHTYDLRKGNLSCTVCHEEGTVAGEPQSPEIAVPETVTSSLAGPTLLSQKSQASWSSPENVSDTLTGSELCSSNAKATCVDKDGNIHVVWHDSYPGSWEVCHAMKSSSETSWSQPEVLSDIDGRTSVYPAIATAADGTVFVVWEDYQYSGSWPHPEVFLSVWNGSGWSTPKLISSINEPGKDSSWYPAISVGGNNEVYVVWQDYRNGPSYIYRGDENGNEQEIAPGTRPSVSGSAANVLCVWQDGGGIKGKDLLGATTATLTSSGYYPSVSVGDTGIGYAVWNENDWSLGYARFEDSAWVPIIASSIDSAYFPSVTVDQAGVPHVAFGYGAVKYTYLEETNWAIPEDVKSDSAYYPLLNSDNSNLLHLVWIDTSDGNSEIYYASKPATSGQSIPMVSVLDDTSVPPQYSHIIDPWNVDASYDVTEAKVKYRLPGDSATYDFVTIEFRRVFDNQLVHIAYESKPTPHFEDGSYYGYYSWYGTYAFLDGWDPRNGEKVPPGKYEVSVSIDGGASIKGDQQIEVMGVDLVIEGVRDDEEDTIGGYVGIGGAPLHLFINHAGIDGTVTLTATTKNGNKIRVWDNKEKEGSPISLPASWTDPAAIPPEIWVEGLEPSASATDFVELKLKYESEDPGRVDTVKITIVKVEIEKCSATFLPKGGGEDNTTTITAIVSPSHAKGKFKFTLYDVSDEPGYCMNAPQSLPGEGEEDSDSWKDLQFPSQIGFSISSNNNAVAETLATDLNESTVTIKSFDYGAYGKIKAEFMIGGELLVAIEKDSISGKAYTKIPLDENANKIADAADQDSDGAIPTTDQDSIPVGDGDAGDGLSIYEEYRGFMVLGSSGRAEHTRTSADQKDLFLFIEDVDDLGFGYLEASELSLHEIDSTQYSPCISNKGREINFHRNENLTATPNGQHILRIVNERCDSGMGKAVPCSPDNMCESAPGYNPPRPRTPGDIHRVVIDVEGIKWYVETQDQLGVKVNEVQQVIDQTIAHEVGHAINIVHHGETNSLLVGLEVAEQGGQNSGVETCVMRYFHADYYKYMDGNFYGYGDDELNGMPGEEPVGTIYCTESTGTGVNAAGRVPRPKTGDATEGKCCFQIRVKDY